VLFIKSKILSINIEENENIIVYMSRIKGLKYKLGNIGNEVSYNELHTIKLNSMLHGYHMDIKYFHHPCSEIENTFVRSLDRDPYASRGNEE